MEKIFFFIQHFRFLPRQQGKAIFSKFSQARPKKIFLRFSKKPV